jgi:hypothetical protein
MRDSGKITAVNQVVSLQQLINADVVNQDEVVAKLEKMQVWC